jgi:hypothetical protein
MKGSHDSQVRSNRGDEYISPSLMSFVKEPHYFGPNLPKFCNKYSRQIQGRTPSATSTLKMETVRSAETYVNVYKIIRPHNPECSDVHYHSPGPDSVVCIAKR